MSLNTGKNLEKWLAELNPQQREAVTHGNGPLLIVAGAGTGKTKTLAYRVSYLISQEVPPERILLLTFTRRAAEEMLKRAAAASLLDYGLVKRVWGGTFHSIANRIIHVYAQTAGLAPEFTILDRSDSEDLLNLVRNDLSLSSKEKRFPRKSTCMEIYTRRVNGNDDLEKILKHDFPWCSRWKEDLRLMFKEYVIRKQKQNLLDYDDLLLYWFNMLKDEEIAKSIGGRFDHILVDEYQDTNPIQAGILTGMRRWNNNITVVGDDAQSIYGFRSATVRNMLDFPSLFPGTRIITLEQNYRSVQPILHTTNQIISQAKERYSKELWSDREGIKLPQLITCNDEDDQDRAVIDRVLEHYEQGIALRKQAVLFRAASHSGSLEIALTRRGIPFHKYGGLRFLEMAHVKDLICILRIAENPRDGMAWFRILQLLYGVGPATAAAVFQHLTDNNYKPTSLLSFKSPAASRDEITGMAQMIDDLTSKQLDPSQQVDRIRQFYIPLIERNYEHAEPRAKDIEHLQQIAGKFRSRRDFLTELALDPPVSTGDLAGPPSKDEDWLILSTIHSAKGLEWDVVYLIHAADGNLPSDMATGSKEQIDEELRLAYVAMTRARDFLYVLWPLRYYSKTFSDKHVYAQCCRFFTKEVTDTMECLVPDETTSQTDKTSPDAKRIDIQKHIAGMWD